MPDRMDATAHAPLSARQLHAHYANVRKRLMTPRPGAVKLKMLPPPATPAAGEPVEPLPADVLAHVVEACRDTDGLLDRVMKWLLVHNALKLGELTTELADEEIARQRTAIAERRITIALILKSTASYYGVSREAIVSHCRTQSIIRPRHVAMYLANTLTPRSLPEIGRMMGKRDHTTVLHGVRKIRGLIETDAELAEEIDAVRMRVEAGL